jgi:uncharacterized membrane protein
MSVFAFMAPRCVAAAQAPWLEHTREAASHARRLPPHGASVWRLDRNCSLAPRSLALVLGWLAAASLGIATFFWTLGAWLVLPFALVEVSALGMAFLVYARHATNGERLWLDGSMLLIEREVSGRIEQREIDVTWLQLRRPEPGARALLLQNGTEEIEIGRWAPAARRQQVWRDMRQALAQRHSAASGTDGST